jgi:hypothetical protein
MGLYDQYLAESDSGETGSDTEPETQYARYLRKKKEEDTARSDAAKPAPGSVRSLLQPLPGAQEPEAVTGPTPVSSAPWMISGRSSGTAQSLPATRVPAAHRGPVMAPTDALNAYDDTPSFEKRLAEARDRDPDAALRDLRRPSPEDEGRIAPRFANKLVGVANLAYTGVRALGHAVAPLAQGMAEFFPDVGIAGAQAAMGNTQPAKDLIRGTTLRPIEQALELGNAAKNRLFGDVPTDFRQKPAIGGGSYTEGALRNYDVGALHVRGDLTGPEAVQNAIDVYFAKGLVEHGLSSPANWIDRRAAFRVKADAAYQAPIDRAYDRAQPAIEGKKLWADEEAGNARSADAAQAYSVTPDGIRATRQLGSGYYEMPSVQEPITDPARVLPARAASLEQPSEINNRFRSTTGPRVDQPAIPMRAPWETITDPRRQLPAVAEGAAAPSQLNNRFGSVSGALQGPAIPLPARMPEATIGVDPPRAGEYATPEQVAQYPARREQGTALKTDLEMIQDARQQRFARAKEEADGDVALAKQSAEDEARAAAPRVRDAKTGLPKKSLQHVADTHIQEELNKLQYEHSTEENAMVAREEDPRWAQVQDLPSTESVGKLGRKAQEAGNEALPDGDGMYDPDELAKLRAEDREYKGNYMVREARLKLMKRLQGELDQRWQTGTQKLLPGETRETQGRGDDTDFDFGANVEDKNGGNENGSNRRGNSRVGVTAALGVGAAGGALGYAAAPNDKKIAGAIGGFAAGAALGIGAVRGAEALGDHLARGGDLAASRFGPDGEVAAGARRPGAIAPLSEDAIRVEAFRQKMQGIIADHAKQTRLSLEGRTGEPTVESTREPWETPQPERFSNRTGAVGDLSEKGTGSPLGSNRKRAPVAGAEDPTAMPPEPAMSGTHNLDYRKLMGAHELGRTRLPVTAAVAGAGVGATIGAASDKDHPIRGAIAGAVAGGLAGGLGGRALEGESKPGSLRRRTGAVGDIGKLKDKAPANAGEGKTFPERLYSRARKAIDEAPFAKGTGEQWKALLKKGVGQDERMAIEPKLEDGKKYTRADVQQLEEASAVKIGERRFADDTPDRPQHGRWTVPGEKSNYREHVLTFEAPGKPFRVDSHFPVDNPLAHVRMSDRVLPIDNGEKSLFVEEMQSDIHQRARADRDKKVDRLVNDNGIDRAEAESRVPADYAYRKAPVEVLTPVERTELDGLNKRWLESLNSSAAVDSSHPTALSEAEVRRMDDLDDRVTNAARQAGSAVLPNAPYKKTGEWTELALKKIIDEAVRGKYKRVVFANGEQSAAHYDLSKAVDRITYNPENSFLEATMRGNIVHQGNYAPGALEDVIGKDAADKLLASEPKANPRRPSGAVGLPVHTLEGEGLKAGGAGMRGYYDKMAPKFIKDYAKKLGVKLELESVELQDRNTPKELTHADVNALVRDTPARSASWHILADVRDLMDEEGVSWREAMDRVANGPDEDNRGRIDWQEPNPRTVAAVQKRLEEAESGKGDGGKDEWRSYAGSPTEGMDLNVNAVNAAMDVADDMGGDQAVATLMKLKEQMMRETPFQDAMRALSHEDQQDIASTMGLEMQHIGEPAPTKNISFKVTPELKDVVTTKGQPRGFAALPAVAAIAGAGVGSLADKDHPIAGALIGGLAGFTLGHKLMAPDRKSIKDGLAGTTNAAGRSDEARVTANTFRVTGGEMARTYEQAHEAMKGFSAAAAKLPAGERLTFINDIETGAPHGTSLKAAGASIIRKTLDTERNKIIALGTGKLQNFIVNYFPHIWEDPNSAGTMLERVMGKRPLEGSKNFLKQRTIPTTLEGMFPKGVPAGLDAMSEAAIRKEVMAQKGLMPVTMNPVDLSLLKLREMQRYLQAHETLGELKARGIATPLAMGENIPPGFARLNDKVATGYIAPEPAARVFNNYLSPGLAGNALYDAVRGYGNALNAAQLGLSAFHLGFTSMDAAVSRMALGIEQMAAGDGIAAIKSIASTPAAPVTNFLKGRKLKDAYLRPGSMGADMEALSQALEMAGGRVKQDSFYRNSAPEKMIEAWRSGEKGKAASLALPSLFEYAARPIMEHIVPAQKLGVFADLAKHEMSKWTDATPMEERVESMRKVWDSVDNRLGQLVYDNLFWDKTFKDLAMVSTRSVGWNVGTIREIGGGIMDTGKQLNSLRKGGKAELTHRMAYIAALPITVGMAGAVTQYLYTGTGPESTKDYFFPRTGTYDVDGNPNRVQLPSYMKDVNAYASHPWQTIKHKLNPGIGSIAAMLNNEDFYGDKIRNESDPYTKQMLDNVRYLAKETLPLGVRNWQESEKRDATWKEKAAGFVGVTAANRGTTRSPAQNLMNELLPKQGARSPDMKQAQTDRGDILRQMREGKDAGDEINAAVSRGNVTARQLRRIQQRSGTLPMIENFKRLSLEDAMRVYDAGDAREQGLWNSALNAKIARAGRP